MKTITVTIAPNIITADDINLGNSGEHNNTKLDIVLQDEAFNQCDFFRLWFGSKYSERLTAQNGVISYSVPQKVMTPPFVKLQLCGYVITDSEPALIVKSGILNFNVERSACCELVCDTAETPFEVLSLECANSARAAMSAASEAQLHMANSASYAHYSEFCSEESESASEKAQNSAELSRIRSDNIIEALNESTTDNISTKFLEQNSASEVKLWVGTKEEFSAIEPLNNTVYLFTDDVSTETIDNILAESKNKPTINEVVDKIYPIGSVYMSVNSVSPETLFGGSWEAIENRFLIGASNEYQAGTVGGNSEHSHTLGSGWANICISRQDGKIVANYIENPGSFEWNRSVVATVDSTTTGTNTYPTSLGGNTDASSNMPPYLAVFMWKRIA